MCVHTPDPDIHTDNGCQSTVPGTGLLKVPQVPQQVWTSTRVQVSYIQMCYVLHARTGINKYIFNVEFFMFL